MRVALVSHELRSDATLRLRSHARGLASALARAGLEVEVFTLEACTRRRLTQRRRQVPVKGADKALGVTSVELMPVYAFVDEHHLVEAESVVDLARGSQMAEVGRIEGSTHHTDAR